jgi:uncharacterized protein (DUF488 family)
MPWFQGPQQLSFSSAKSGSLCDEALETTLPRAGIHYHLLKALGGRRKKLRDDSPNTALRSPAFRNYADYMLTPEFQHGIEELLQTAARSRTCIMCAEAQVYYHCHRMLVSDYLVAQGHTVLHISGKGEAKPHHMTDEARVENGVVTYPSEPTLF